jgi:hypothetical protein
VNESALQSIYAIETSHPPASVRPDPDMFMRLFLRQFHEDGATMARVIGQAEAYRPLVGGASVDFSTPPQLTYDATSLLTMFQLGKSACSALIDPNSTQHGEWASILPSVPDEVDENINFLAKRILGLPLEEVDAESLSSLKQILDAARDESGNYVRKSYVPVCVALLTDARSLFL